MGLGGWAITEQCFEWMLANVPAGSKVLEFGSGMGTGELVKHYDMTSIEQDSFWLNGFTGTRYIHAPLDGHWYSWDALEAGNLEDDYAMILIDSRLGFQPLRGKIRKLQEWGFVIIILLILQDFTTVLSSLMTPTDQKICSWLISSLNKALRKSRNKAMTRSNLP